jgi:nicotinate phosphoribosyltransferase
LIATKAARSVLLAPGKQLVDFGMRRAHGAEAALLAARASYLAGFSGTATTMAGALYGIPLFGTMAHSYVQAHTDELEAFEHFTHSFPHDSVLLIDTYDTEAAAQKVVLLGHKLAQTGIRVKGVRLDSGDLAVHAREVRRILDRGGLRDTSIFASGNLDEYQLSALIAADAPIDGFGIGTALDVSSDAPSLDFAYKLQEYAGKARRKRSEGKATWPGRKQVYRSYDASDGGMTGDIVAMEKNDQQAGHPLIRQAMREGKRVGELMPLSELRLRTLAGYDRLPKPLITLEQAPVYPVEISASLRALATCLDTEFARGEPA